MSLVRSGAKQGGFAAWRVLERQRGQVQETVAQLERRRVELEASIAALDAERDRLQVDLEREQAGVKREQQELRRLRAERDALERDGELSRRITSDEELVQLLAEVGEQRVEDACVALGWIEA
jgi:hypothetical protein